MPKVAYPIASDLQAFLLAAGFTTAFVASLDLATAVLAGQQAFEEATGRRFLATTQTREYDPQRVSPRGILDLLTDALSVSSVAWGTITFTATDYHLLRLNAVDDTGPYSLLDFGRYRYWWPTTWPVYTPITVIGSFGYGTTIPDAAWSAMLAAAALFLFPQIMQQSTAGMDAWNEADMHEQYGMKAFLALHDGWRSVLYGTGAGPGQPPIGGAAQLYKRVTQG